MGDAALHRATDKTLEFVGLKQADREQQSDAAAPLRRSPTRIDAVMDSVKADIAKGTEHKGPETEADLRSNAVEEIQAARTAIGRAIAQGCLDAYPLLSTPDKLPPRIPPILLDAAAAMVIAGSASGIATTVAASIVKQTEKKVVEYTIKEGIKSIGKHIAASNTHEPIAREHLIDSFRAMVGVRILEAQKVLSSPLNAALQRLSTSELVPLAERVGTSVADSAALYKEVITAVMVAWTNFLARASYGAMRGWNIWEDNGGQDAVRLDGAAAAPIGPDATREIAAGNVAPNAMDAVADSSNATGILEIDMAMGGVLFERARGHGMRLANVGPKVREKLRELGPVRNAPINKLIRLYDVSHVGSEEVVQEIGSILITADGYVRRYDLGPETQIHPDPRPITLREVVGIDHRKFRPHRAANEAIVRDIAERAQDLPMSKVEA